MAKSTHLSETKEDIAEYQKLLELAQRPKVQDILKKQISILKIDQSRIEKEIQLQIKKAQQVKQANQIKQHSTSNEQTASTIIYSALTKYSWEDESKKAKIYFTLENIGNQCQANQIDVQFKSNSVQLRIRNYRKQNLIFSIKKTCSEIVPEQCKYLVKTNLLSITLMKKKSGTWTQLNFKDDKFAKEKEKEEIQDPNASLMNMMKKMYDEGDENMKRTIAEAWTKSRDQKGSESFKLD